jgi:hypothetical protein
MIFLMSFSWKGFLAFRNTALEWLDSIVLMHVILQRCSFIEHSTTVFLFTRVRSCYLLMNFLDMMVKTVLSWE